MTGCYVALVTTAAAKPQDPTIAASMLVSAKILGSPTRLPCHPPHGLPSRDVEPHGLGAPATRGEEAPTDALHAMG
jgi:hypothetical protein